MIEMGVRQQQEINRRGIEAEVAGVLLVELAAALIEAAVDQHARARAFDKMAGAGDAPVGAVEGYFHGLLSTAAQSRHQR